MLFKRKRTQAAYQYYANVNPRTCGACLARHGRLFDEPEAAPPRHPGCRCRFLEVGPEDLQAARERAERMQAKARDELRRRAQFAEALAQLEADAERALDCLREAVAIDIHLEELDALQARHRARLDRDPALARTLRGLFVGAYFDKLDQPRYRNVSAGWTGELEHQGRTLIKTWFADPDGR